MTLALFTFSGITLIAFVQTKLKNGYTTLSDINNNLRTVHSSYVTDLTDFTDQQKKAMHMFNHANFA